MRLSEIVACPMCKSDWLDETDNGLQCSACLRVFPKLDGILNMMPDTFREVCSSDNSWTHWQQMQEIYKQWVKTDWSLDAARSEHTLYADFMQRCEPKNKLVLDLGGFWGMNRAWSSGARFYFVIDPDDEERRSPSMDYHKQLYPFYGTPFPFIKAVGEYLPVRNNAVDLIVIQDALDHFLAAKTVIYEAYRTLCKRGVLAIMADVTDSTAQRTVLENFAWVLKSKGFRGVVRGLVWKLCEVFNYRNINRHGHMREFSRADIMELLSIFDHVEVQEPSVEGFPHLYFFAQK